MRPEYQKYQLIDDYLNNKLSRKESLEFEQVLKEDPEFHEEVFDQKLTNEVIIEKRFFEVMDSINIPIIAPKPAAPISAIKPILGITLTAGISVLTLLYFLKDSDTKVQQQDVPLISKEIKKEPVILPKEDIKESPDVPGIIADNESDNVKEAKEIPAVRTERNKKKEIVEDPNDGTYSFEIPLENHNQAVYNFNPEKGESWTIPLKGNKKAALKIIDKTGREVFRINITKGYPRTWDGSLKNESKVEDGNYAYLLDFGNGKVEHGYLSINRSQDSVDK